MKRYRVSIHFATGDAINGTVEVNCKNVKEVAEFMMEYGYFHLSISAGEIQVINLRQVTHVDIKEEETDDTRE